MQSDLFNFTILDEDIIQNGKHAIKIAVVLKTESLTKQYDALIKYKKEIQIFFNKINNLQNNFLRYKGAITQEKLLINELYKYLEDIKIITLKATAMSVDTLNKSLQQFNFYLMGEGKKEGFKDLVLNASKLQEEINFEFERMEVVLKKVRELNNQKLFVQTSFKVNSFQTSFVKYHINMEGHSDLFHNILKNEIKVKIYDKYKQMESAFFKYSDKLNFPSDLKIKDIITISKILSKLINEINNLNPYFLKAQPQYSVIMSDSEYVMEMLISVTEKLTNIISYIHLEKKSIELSLKTLSFLEQVAYKDLEKMTRDKVLLFTSKIDEKYPLTKTHYDNFLLPVLAIFDPKAVNEIKKNLISSIKRDDGYTSLEYDDGFLLKKSAQQFFSNSQFYSHIVGHFKFFSDHNYKTTRFNSFSSVDKVPINETVYLKEGSIKSKILNRNINYNSYIFLETARVNISNNMTVKTIKKPA